MERRKVLIVDDDREIVDLIELYLAGENYDILKAYDGEECLSILREETVSLLVLDIMMPKLDGLAVCGRVRETSNIPIILITAKTQPLERVQGLSTGALTWWLNVSVDRLLSEHGIRYENSRTHAGRQVKLMLAAGGEARGAWLLSPISPCTQRVMRNISL
jgi:CheY-like chemotaxis protein